MQSSTPSEARTAEVKQAAHMGRVSDRTDHIAELTQLLKADDKATVLTSLLERGFLFEEGFESKELSEIKDAIREAIASMEESNNEVAGLSTAIQKGIVQASKATVEDVDKHETELEPRQKELEAKKNVLTPEAQAALLGKLKKRFEANMNRHEDVSWDDLQRSLKAAPEKLWSLQQMEEAGHAPDIYMEDDGAYTFGTCSLESPVAHRNIVFDSESEALAEASEESAVLHDEMETFNGNAVDIAAAMGIDLMDTTQYRYLQTLGKFDFNSWSWLKTSVNKRKSGRALIGRNDKYVRHDEPTYVSQSEAYTFSRYGAFRGSIRVSKV